MLGIFCTVNNICALFQNTVKFENKVEESNKLVDVIAQVNKISRNNYREFLDVP